MFIRFLLAWALIAAVSAYDTYLSVKHIDVMGDEAVELNPIGALIIARAGGVAGLVATKSMGIALALLFSFILWQRRSFRRKMLKCSYSVAVFQLALLGYLSTDFVGMHTRGMAAHCVQHGVARPGNAETFKSPPIAREEVTSSEEGPRARI